MTNNDALRRIRYTFDFTDSNMIKIFGLGNYSITRADVSNLLKKEEDPSHTVCSDKVLACFLNGLIIEKRGPKDGPTAEPEERLTNNMIFRKLKIALDLKADDVLKIMNTTDIKMSKHELSALFRKPDHKNYRECHDQILRNFLKGLQQKYRIRSQTTQFPTS